MKIYIETEMKQMPKGCRVEGNDCLYLYMDGVCDYWCNANWRENMDNPPPKTRPSWCPLRTEKEIKEEIK